MDSIKTQIFIIFDFLLSLIAFCVVGVSVYSFQFLVHTLNNNMDNKLLLLSDKLDIVSLAGCVLPHHLLLLICQSPASSNSIKKSFAALLTSV